MSIDKIESLLRAKPLPPDAEAQLERLVDALPEAERAEAERWFEALATARGSEDFDGRIDDLKWTE